MTGRVLSDQALVASDQARAGLDPTGFDPSRWKLERYDSISTRILDGAGSVFAMIEQLGNGRWIIVTGAGTRVHGRTFTSIKSAFEYQKTETAIAIEARRAATGNTDAVHESADPKGIAQ